MRQINRFLILSSLAAGVPWHAVAQVSVDPHALDTLSTPAAPASEHKPPTRHPQAVQHHTAPAHPAAPARQSPEKPATAKPAPPAPLPVIPPAPPPAVVIPPPIIVPIPPPAPPPPVPVSPAAAGSASDLPDGVRVTFGPGTADLNPATQAALVAIAQKAKATPGEPVNILAHAPEIPDDPSTPRRLSLTRALVARAVLINQGIDSTRIYVKALGPTDLDGGPADRVDVVLSPTPTPATPPAPAGGPAASKPPPT